MARIPASEATRKRLNDSNVFHDYFDAHPGAIDLWLGSHTHAHPDDRYGDKAMVTRRWGVTFANVGAMPRYHGRANRRWWPSSRLLTFEQGRNRVRLQCYVHTSHYAQQGWYDPAEQVIELRIDSTVRSNRLDDARVAPASAVRRTSNRGAYGTPARTLARDAHHPAASSSSRVRYRRR